MKLLASQEGRTLFPGVSLKVCMFLGMFCCNVWPFAIFVVSQYISRSGCRGFDICIAIGTINLHEFINAVFWIGINIHCVHKYLSDIIVFHKMNIFSHVEFSRVSHISETLTISFKGTAWVDIRRLSPYVIYCALLQALSFYFKMCARNSLIHVNSNTDVYCISLLFYPQIPRLLGAYTVWLTACPAANNW